MEGASLLLVSIGLLPQALTSGIIFGMIFALVAAGLALIWGVADIVNFAHGEYMLIAMYVTVVVTGAFGIDPLWLVPVNAALLFLCGYVTYWVVMRRAMEGPMLAQIFSTFALLLILRYSMFFVFGATARSVDEFVLEGSTLVGGIVISHPELATAGVSVVALVLLYVLLKRTKTGLAIRAIAQDPEVATVMGVDRDRTLAITWGVGLAAVGVAGTLVATFQPVQPTATPTTWTIIAFAAVALGGFGEVYSAAVGGVIIGIVEHVGPVLLDPSYTQLYVFLVFILVLLFRPEGIINVGGS
jgi:branched-chain amino acid transport system permease protein